MNINFIDLKKHEAIIEWSATAILIVGVALTSWNIYPVNVYFSLLGNLMWLGLGFLWKKYSLVIVQLIVSVIYILGTMKAMNLI